MFSLPPVVWSNHDPREMDGATMGVQSSLQKYFFKNLEKCTSSNSPENMCRSIPRKCRLKFVKITIPGGRAAPQQEGFKYLPRNIHVYIFFLKSQTPSSQKSCQLCGSIFRQSTFKFDKIMIPGRFGPDLCLYPIT